MIKSNEKKGIAYSCYYENSRAGENFTAQHTLSYIESGSIILDDGKTTFPGMPGSLRLVRKNTLIKYQKKPAGHEPFKSLSIYFNFETLYDFAREHQIDARASKNKSPVINLVSSVLLDNYLFSILEYLKENSFDDPFMVDLKLKEGLMLLVKSHPELSDILFDFSIPYKIDLVSFMNENYHFNVGLDRFAYLTGRSLAAFKRDFEKEFGISPGRWLTTRRLQEAYSLISLSGKTGSDIYYDLGFEDFSHFSFAFRKKYGVTPSQLKQGMNQSIHVTPG